MLNRKYLYLMATVSALSVGSVAVAQNINGNTNADEAQVASSTPGFDNNAWNNTPQSKKGQFGGSKWYLNDDGELHFGPGEFDGFTEKKPDSNGHFHGPFETVEPRTKKIVFDGPIVLAANSQDLFANFVNLIEVTNANNLDFKNVVSMLHMFHNAKYLRSMDTSTWTMPKVQDMGGAFQYIKVKKLDISNWNPINLTSLWGAFKGADVEKLDFSEWTTSQNVITTNMLNDIPNLKILNFGSNFKAKNINLPGDGWFFVGKGKYNNPESHEKISQYNGNKPGEYVRSGAIFDDEDILENPDGTRGFDKNAYKKAQYKEQRGEVFWYLADNGELHIGGGYDEINDRPGLLANPYDYNQSPWSDINDKITKIIFDEPVQLPKASQYLFSNLPNVTEIIGLETLKTSEVMHFEHMFDGLTKIKNLDISHFDTRSASKVAAGGSMNAMFDNTPNLRKIKFGPQFIIAHNYDDAIKLFGQSQTKKWRGMGDSTDENKPNGVFIQKNSFNDSALITEQSLVVPETYILTDYIEEKMNVWKPGQDVNTDENKGTYGEEGLENYVLKSDPWQDEIDKDTVGTDKLLKVKAKGIAGTLKWYISEDNVLHLGSGTPKSIKDKSPWTKIDSMSQVTEISVDGKVKLPADSSNLFASTDAVSSSANKDVFSKVIKFSKTQNLDFSNVTNLKRFLYGFTSLKTIEGFETWNTSKVTNFDSAFSSMKSIETLDVSNLNTSSATTVNSIFQNNSNITEYKGLENLDVSNVVNAGFMFDSNKKLVNLSGVEKWNTAHIKYTISMFSNTGIVSLNLNKWNVSSLMYTDTMFSLTNSLKTIIINEWKTPKLLSTLRMFASSGLEELDISNLDTSKSNVADGMFNNMEHLRKIKIGNKFKIPINDNDELILGNQTDGKKWQEIGNGTDTKPNGKFIDKDSSGNIVLTNDNFKAGTYVLSDITINAWKPGSGVNTNENKGTYGDKGLENYVLKSDPWKNEVNESFIGTDKLLKVKAKGITGTLKWYIDEDNVLHLGSGTPKAIINSNGHIGISPWKNVKGINEITEISIDGEIKLPEDSAFMFAASANSSEFSKVTKISHAENLDLSKTTNLEQFISNLPLLKTIEGIERWDVSSVIDFTRTFSGLRSLETLDLSNFDTSNAVTFNGMFEYNSNAIEYRGLENFKTSKLQNTGFMFDYNSKLKNLSAVENFNMSGVTYAEGMFKNTAIESLDLNKWDVSKLTTSTSMFQSTPALKKLLINNWKTNSLSISRSMFEGSGLEELDLSNFDTSHMNGTNISNTNDMFDNMKSLKKITIGNNFKISNDGTNKTQLGNQTDSKKWRELGTGTEVEPTGNFIDEKSGTMVTLTNDNFKPGTYVLGTVLKQYTFKVEDIETDKGIPNAQFDMFDEQGNLAGTIKTDAQGGAIINLPPAKYTIKQHGPIYGYLDADDSKLLSTGSQTIRYRLYQDMKNYLPSTGKKTMLVLFGIATITLALVGTGLIGKTKKDFK